MIAQREVADEMLERCEYVFEIEGNEPGEAETPTETVGGCVFGATLLGNAGEFMAVEVGVGVDGKQTGAGLECGYRDFEPIRSPDVVLVAQGDQIPAAGLDCPLEVGAHPAGAIRVRDSERRGPLMIRDEVLHRFDRGVGRAVVADDDLARAKRLSGDRRELFADVALAVVRA